MAVFGDLRHLLCLESESPKRSVRDPAILGDSRVLKNLLELDERHTPSTNYFILQTDLKPSMREILTNWMLEVATEENLEEEIFPLSVNYVDRFLSVSSRPIKRTQLQLLGCVCLFIASKYRGTSPISTRRLVWFTDNSITQDEIIEWELVVLQGLKWDLSSNTPFDFIDHLFNLLPFSQKDVTTLRKHAALFIHLCATDVKLGDLPSSMIAVSSIMAAVNGHPFKTRYNDSNLLEKLSEITSVDKDLIRMCQEQIETLLASRIAESEMEKRAALNTFTTSTTTTAGSSSSADDSDTKSTSSSASKLPKTPTDVRDIVLVDKK